jgi:hypothetical protein
LTVATGSGLSTAEHDQLMALSTANLDAPVSGVPAAVLAAATTTPIAANVKKMNSATVTGTGISTDLWRGV